jgi:hypothetical protein
VCDALPSLPHCTGVTVKEESELARLSEFSIWEIVNDISANESGLRIPGLQWIFMNLLHSNVENGFHSEDTFVPHPPATQEMGLNPDFIVGLHIPTV